MQKNNPLSAQLGYGSPDQAVSRRNKLMSRTALGAAFGLMSGVALSPSAAAQIVWEGGVSYSFDDGDNWDSGTAPGSTDTVELSSTDAPNQPIILSSTHTINGLTISAGALSLQAPGATSELTVTGDVNISSGTFQIGPNSRVNANRGTTLTGGTLVVEQGGTHVGEVSLTNARYRLSGTQTGRVDLNSGAALIGGNTTLGGMLHVNGPATISAATGTTFVQNELLFIYSDITIGSATERGTVVLDPVGFGYSREANLIVAGGTLRAPSSNYLGEILGGIQPDDSSTPGINSTTVNSGATLDINTNDMRINRLGGAGTIMTSAQGNRSLTLHHGSDFGGVITDSAHANGGIVSLNRTGDDTTTLTGANTYTGSTNVLEGTLAITGEGSIASTAVSVSENAVFETDGGALRAATNVANSGTFRLTGAETISGLTGGGAVDLTNSGALTMTGNAAIGTLTGSDDAALTIRSGTTSITDASAYEGLLDLEENGALSFAGDFMTGGHFQNDGELTIGNDATFSAASITNTNQINVSNGATLRGTGNTLNNDDTINVGTNGTVSDAGDINNNAGGGVIKFNGPGGTATLASGGTINNSGLIELHGGDLNITGDLVNSGLFHATTASTITHEGNLSISGGIFSVSNANLTSRTITLEDSGQLTGDPQGSISTGTFTYRNGYISELLNLAADNYVFDNSASLTLMRSLGDNDETASTFTQSGSGTTTLIGANTYSGGTTVSAGRLFTAANGNLGASSGSTLVTNGNLYVDNNVTQAAVTLNGSGSIGGSGTLTTTTLSQTGGTISGTVNASGAQTLNGGTISGNLSGAGAVTVQTGETVLTGTINSESIAINSGGTLSTPGGLNNTAVVTLGETGNLTLTGSGTIRSLIGTGGEVAIGATSTLFVSSGSYAGDIGGAGNLNVTGNGTLTLTGENSYTGTTTISGGTLAVTGAGRLASSAIVIDDGAELATDGDALAESAVITINAGALFRIQGGSERISAVNAAGDIEIQDDNVLTLTGGTSQITGAISGDGGLTLAGGDVALYGNNTYTGATTLNSGILVLVSATSIADDAELVLNGGVTIIDTDQTIGTLSGTGGMFDIGANHLTISGAGNSSYAGATIGRGSLTRSGNGATTLIGMNDYTGGTTVAGGELITSGFGTLGRHSNATEVTDGKLTVNNNVTQNGGVTLNGSGEIGGMGTLITTTFNQTGGTVSGTINASGDQTLNGGTILGHLTGEGAVTVQNGITTLSGTVASDEVRVQNNGTLTLSSNAGGVSDYATVTVAATGTLNVQSDEIIGRLINNQTVNIADAVTLAAASISNTGTLSIGEGATLQGTGNTLNNAAAINVATDGNVVDVGDINNDATGNINFNGPGGTGTLESGGTINNAGAINLIAGNLDISGSVVNDATGTITLASNYATVAMNGNLTNSTGGQVNVTGDNMVINQIGDVTNNGDYTVTGSGVVIHQTGDLISDGTLSLNDASYTATNITIDGGSVTGLAGSSLTATGSLIQNAGHIDSTVTVSSGAYAFTNDAPETVIVDGTIVDGSNLISNVLQSGSGITTLSNDNTYSGSTTVNNGILEVSATGSIRNSFGVTVTGDGQFIVNGGALGTDTALNVAGNDAALSVNGNETAASLMQSGGSSVVGGNGTLTLSGAYSQTGGATSGALTVNSSTFTQSKGAILAAGTSVNSSGTQTLNGGTIAGNLSGAGEVNVRNGTTTLTGSGAIASNSVNIVSGTLYNQNAGLSSNATVNVSGGSLTNEMDSTIAALNQTGGAINGSGILTTGNFTQSNGATLASGTTVNATDTQTLNGGTIAGNLSGAGSVTVQNGVTMLSGDISGSNNFTVSGGELYVTGAGSVDTNSHVINVSGGILRSASANAIADSHRVHVTGDGQYILESSDTIAALSGDGFVRLVNDAQLDLGTSNASMDFSGNISGNGTIYKSGSGTLSVTGNSRGFGGRTTLADGALLVSGALGGSVDVMSGAVLAGNGTIGSGSGSAVTVMSGGQISPTSSIGTMTINGNLTFEQGSRLTVETEPNHSRNASIQVIGTATLNGGTVAHIGASGNYDIRSTYTVLSAGTLTGEFDQVTTDFAFLTPTLIYDRASANVQLQLDRNDREFSSVATTRNQIAVARAIESIGPEAGHPIYDAISSLPDDQNVIRESFDALTGDIHASLRTMLLEDSQFVRNATNDRMRHSFKGAGADNESSFWVHGLASRGEMDGGSEAADIDRSMSGFLLGADRSLADWNLGVMAGYSHSNLERNKPAADSSVSNYHLGFYGGTKMGNVALRAGAAHTWHSISVGRTVVFQNYADGLSSDYDAETSQVFSEIGYDFSWGSTNLEPFANLSYARLRTDAFTETGGAAALSVSGEASDVSFSTIGLRAENTVSAGSGNATLSGMLGWRNTLFNQQQKVTHAFSSGDDFMVSGLLLSRNSAVAEAGVAFRFAPAAVLNLSYQGQMSPDITDHGFRFRVNVAF